MRTKIHTKRACPCCGNTTAEVLTDMDFIRTEVLPKHYDIVCCSDCGMCFAELDGSQEIYNQYYEQFNNYTYDAKIKISSIKGTDYEKIYEYIAEHYPKNIRIIDVGCGGGILLQCLKHAGYDHVTGLDPCENSIAQLQNNGINGRVGNIFDVIHEDDVKAYDLVLSTGVMEHIYDVDLYVRKLAEYMKDDGEGVLVAVPSAEGFPKRKPPKPHCFNHEHINYYSIYSLDNTMQRHGLSRINEEYTILDTGGWVVYGIYKPLQEQKLMVKDIASREAILEYLENWDGQVENIEKKINELVRLKTPIVVFGVGCFLEWLLIQYPEVREQIIYCVDNNPSKQKESFLNLAVFSSDKICESVEATILVCSMLYAEDIVQQLNTMSVNNEIVVL